MRRLADMARRVNIVFSRPDGASVRKGPFDRLVLEGEVMRAEPGAAPVAKHESRHWQVGSEPYTRAECDCPCTLHFVRADEATSKTYGPFESVSFVDGVAYANREVFAFADRSIVDWYCHEDGHHYPVLIIEPAD